VELDRAGGRHGTLVVCLVGSHANLTQRPVLKARA